MPDQNLVTSPEPGANDPFAVYEFDVTGGHDHDSLTMRWGGREVVTHEVPIETPSWAYCTVKYCIWGNGILEWENERWEISKGMIFWSTERNANTLTVSAGQGMANFAVVLAGQEAMRLMERCLYAPVGAVRVNNAELIEKIMLDIMDEGRATALHREENCALLAQVLLRRIEAHSAVAAHNNTMARSTFKRCREYIAQNFMRLTMLKEVAEACEVSVPYLCRLFDQFFHCSPHDYITRMKMSRAENLLLRPRSPIREVAVAVGYKDARLFARNFKALYGKSPTEYRQVHAAGGDTVVEDE